MQPLNLLRNVNLLAIRRAIQDEIKDFGTIYDNSYNGLFSGPGLQARAVSNANLCQTTYEEFETEFRELLKRTGPVEYVFRMYRNLLKYARSFEKYKRFGRQTELLDYPYKYWEHTHCPSGQLIPNHWPHVSEQDQYGEPFSLLTHIMVKAQYAIPSNKQRGRL